MPLAEDFGVKAQGSSAATFGFRIGKFLGFLVAKAIPKVNLKVWGK